MTDRAAENKTATLPAAALAALQAGNKLDAIKLLREQTGLDLTQAKTLIERYLADSESLERSATPHDNGDLPAAAKAALYKGNVIDAIKIVREHKRIDLKDAKQLVDRYLLDEPTLHNRIRMMRAEAGRRLLGWLIVIALLVAGGYYVVTAL